MVYTQSGVFSLICFMFTISRKGKWSRRSTSVMDTPFPPYLGVWPS